MTERLKGRPDDGRNSAELRPMMISVIIVNWNGRHFLETCLSSLRRQTFRDFETILVDNGSTDGSTEYVRSHFPEVKLISLPENRGFTGGNVAGWEQARGELIALLNNDTEAHPQWLEEICKASLAFPKAGSFASKMLQFDERNRIDNCGFDLTTTGTAVDVGRGELDDARWSKACEVFGACGGAAVYRRNMLEDVGFFDSDFFAIYEDVDLAFRSQLRGYGCVFVPGAVVYHRYHGTLNVYPARRVLLSQRNAELFYAKNMPTAALARSLPGRVIYELGAFLYFSALGQARPFLSAKAQFFCSLRATLAKRRNIQRTATTTGRQIRALLRPDDFHERKKNLRRIVRAFSSRWAAEDECEQNMQGVEQKASKNGGQAVAEDVFAGRG